MGTASIDKTSAVGEKYRLTAQEVELLQRRTEGDKNADIDEAARQIKDERVGPAATAWADEKAAQPTSVSTSTHALNDRLMALEAAQAEKDQQIAELQAALNAQPGPVSGFTPSASDPESPAPPPDPKSQGASGEEPAPSLPAPPPTVTETTTTKNSGAKS